MRKHGRKELEAMVDAAERRANAAPKGARVVKPTPAAGVSSLAGALANLPGFAELSAEAEAAQRAHEEELRRYREESRQLSASRSAAAGDLLAADARAWEDLVGGERAPEPDGIAPWEPERTPVLFVRTSLGGSLHDYGIEDGSNWAKWQASASGDAIATVASVRVSFFHLWRNARRRQVLADITVGMTANGHLAAEADGMGFPAGLIWDNSSSEVVLTAQLTVWPLWVADSSQLYQSVELGSASASGGVFGDSGGSSVAEAAQLQATRIAVPRGASLLIEASIVADFRCYSGSAEADLASRDSFVARCPYCVVIS